MGYVIRKLNAKSRAWKVQFQSRVSGKLVTNDIKDPARLGFDQKWSIDEARQLRDSLNAQEALKRIETKRVKIAERVEESRLKVRAHFPSVELAEFEKRELFRLIKPGSVAWQKRQFNWDGAAAVIAELNVAPSDWSDERARFYDAFLANEWSPSYVQKILPLINKWGAFFARRRRVFFEPIPFPSGNDLEALAEAHFERGIEKASKPLTPDQLEKGRKGDDKGKLSGPQYNWLYLTVWFGLRPLECDNLHKPQGERTWRLDTSGAKPVLWVYQTKLHGKGLKPAERLKPIPCICPEQLDGLKIIKSGEFERPLVKTIKRYCGPNINTYGGRKGFTDLWLGRGQSLENISIWLGHRSIERTWKSYKDKQKVRWD